MRWMWIPALLLALVVLLGLTRLWVRYSTAGPALEAGFGPFRVRILPRRPPGKRRKKRKKKPAPEPEPEEAAPPGTAFTLADAWDALRTLPGPVRRALVRLARGIRVRPLSLTYTAGGDPVAAAVAYGRASALVWAVMPVLERLVEIPDPEIAVNLDFDAPESTLEGTAGVSLRLGTLLAAGVGIGIPALGWFLRTRRRSGETEPDEKDGEG